MGRLLWALVAVVAISVTGAVIEPSQSATILSLAGMICVALIKMLQNENIATANSKKLDTVVATQKDAEVKVEQVKTDLIKSNNQQTEAISDIQLNMKKAIALPLKIAADAARTAAQVTGDVAHHANAEATEKALYDHLADDKEAKETKVGDWAANKAKGPT
jgi:hypothetical protein